MAKFYIVHDENGTHRFATKAKATYRRMRRIRRIGQTTMLNVNTFARLTGFKRK